MQTQDEVRDWEKRFYKLFGIHLEPAKPGEFIDLTPLPSIDDLEQFIANELARLQRESDKRVEEAWSRAEKHGTLSVPNPYGSTVEVLRHNQVIREMRSVFFRALKSKETNTKQ